MPHGAKEHTRDHSANHPPEEVLEVLVLDADELSPALRGAITQHAQACVACREILALLIQFHRDLVIEDASASPHIDALVRVVFRDYDAAHPGNCGCGTAPSA